MKEKELRELATCLVCREKVGQKQSPIFWKVSMQRHMLDLAAISKQNGLGMMLGGTGGLAMAMGTDADMTVGLGAELTFGLCDACVISHLSQVFEGLDEEEK